MNGKDGTNGENFCSCDKVLPVLQVLKMDGSRSGLSALRREFRDLNGNESGLKPTETY